MLPLPKKYELILADPPWKYNDKLKNGNRGASCKYSCMDLDDICDMPVPQMAADNCLLAMWWVGPQPMAALQVVNAWGFTLKNMTGFSWHKETVNRRSHFGMGRYTRGNVENCLFATRGKPKRVAANVRQYVSSLYRGHSVKPPEVAERLVDLMSDVPRVELFAREINPGWDVFGNEVEQSISLLPYEIEQVFPFLFSESV